MKMCRGCMRQEEADEDADRKEAGTGGERENEEFGSVRDGLITDG